MAMRIKDGGNPGAPTSQTSQPANNPTAAAYARLNRSGKAGKRSAADAVGDLIDDVVGAERDLGGELAAARDLADEVSRDLPPGSGMEQAEAIAERLKQRIEATRDDRSQMARKVQKAFDDLSE